MSLRNSVSPHSTPSQAPTEGLRGPFSHQNTHYTSESPFCSPQRLPPHTSNCPSVPLREHSHSWQIALPHTSQPSCTLQGLLPTYLRALAPHLTMLFSHNLQIFPPHLSDQSLHTSGSPPCPPHRTYTTKLTLHDTPQSLPCTPQKPSLHTPGNPPCTICVASLHISEDIHCSP